MTRAHDSIQSPSATHEPTAFEIPHAVVALLPAIDSAVTWPMIGRALAIGSAVTFICFLTGGLGRFLVFPLVLFTLVGVPAWIIYSMLRWRRQRRLDPPQTRHVSPDSWSAEELKFGYIQLLRYMVAGRNGLYRSNYGYGEFDRFNHARQSMALPRVRAVVASALRKRLAAIEPVHVMLEPEVIPLCMLRSTDLFQIANLSLLAFPLGFGSAFLFIFVIGAIVALVFRYFCRHGLPISFPGASELVVGVGVVETSSGQRWTVEDSTMILSMRGLGELFIVWLVGPAGWMPISFSSPTDPRFIDLWQRWTHPTPRPELAVVGEQFSNVQQR